MFKIYFKTIKYRPDLQVTIRSQQIQGWQEDFPGDFENDAWVFTLDEDLFANGMEFKFVLEEQLYMMGNNLAINPIAGGGPERACVAAGLPAPELIRAPRPGGTPGRTVRCRTPWRRR